MNTVQFDTLAIGTRFNHRGQVCCKTNANAYSIEGNDSHWPIFSVELVEPIVAQPAHKRRKSALGLALTATRRYNTGRDW